MYLSSFDHLHNRPAVFVVIPFHNVHERSHKKNSSTVALQQVFGIRRIWDLIDSESGTVVANSDLETFRRSSKGQVYGLFVGELVPVLYGVRDRLTDREIDSRNKVFSETLLLREFVRLDRRDID